MTQQIVKSAEKETAIKNELAKRLRSMRNMLHLTQASLAERIGITQPYLAELERGDKHPSIDVLQKLCGELNCSADYLLGLSDSKSYKPLGEERLPVMPSGSGNSSDVMRLIAERNISHRDLKLALDLVKTIQDGQEKE